MTQLGSPYGHDYSRRTLLTLLAGTAFGLAVPGRAQSPTTFDVYKDPNCGCCSGWIAHLKQHGFATTVTDTAEMNAVKARLGIPPALASCHTAKVGGYAIEGHVPAHAIRRLLAEKPDAIGLSVPGMPIGSPGMEGGTPEIYEVVLFTKSGHYSFGRYREATPL